MDFSDIRQEAHLVMGDHLRDDLLMCIGDPTNPDPKTNVYVPKDRIGRPGLVYVHLPVGNVVDQFEGEIEDAGTAPEFAVLPPGLIGDQRVIYGAYVRVVKKGNDHVITGIDHTLGNEFFDQFIERIQRPIPIGMFEAGLIWPTNPSSGKVTVREFPVVLNGEAYWPPAKDSSDLIAAYEPATPGQAVAVMIETDPVTNTHTYTASSAFTNPATNNDPLTQHRSVFNNYPTAVDDGRILHGWVKIYNGQQTIEIEDILPAQEIFNKGGAGGGAGSAVDPEEMAWMGVGTSNLITGKRLADGQLPDTKTSLYTAPASTTTRISSIILHNTASSDRTVTLYAKINGGTSRVILNDTLHARETLEFIPPSPIIIPAQGAIEGEASVAVEIDYWISGGERLTPATGVIVSHIADGQLPNSATALYTVPAGKTLTLTSIILVADSIDGAPDDELVEIWLTNTGDRYLLYEYLENLSGLYEYPNAILDESSQIVGKAETASRVDYWISGVLK